MNANHTCRVAGRAAFTLVELLVVIGLMAMLGTISVTGYYAATRGMADRGAMEDVMSIIRLAQQTCLIDQTPTAVLFYNRQTQEQSANVSSEEADASSSGTAIAIKMAGRISYIRNNKLFDEFADWNQSYPVSTSGSASDAGIRFYRMMDLSQVQQGLDKCSSVMNVFVEKEDLGEEYMIASGKKVRDWCNDYKKNGSDNMQFSGTYYDNANSYRWGRGFKGGSGLSASQWKIGDAYGVEIASCQLPKGYIFGTSVPGSTEIKSLPSLTFSPSDVSSSGQYSFSLNQTVSISAFRPDGQLQKVGDISQSDLKDD